MSKLRFSILTLLGSVASVALGCAALVNANGMWAGAMLTFTILALAVATLNVLLDGRRARFSIGFSTLGWIYLVIALTSNVGQQLLTTQLINYAAENWRGQRNPSTAVTLQGYQLPSQTAWRYTVTQPVQFAFAPANSPDVGHFATIGQTLWTLFLALVGGLLSVCLSAQKSKVNQNKS